MAQSDDELASLLGRVFGRPIAIERRTPLGGGSINLTERVDTDVGSCVVKSNQHASRDFFSAEADGLRALANSGTDLTIPRVLACPDTGPRCLVIEYLEPASRARDFEERLGRGLARLHQLTAARFGFASDNFCGATSQPNPWTERWVDFYAVSRLGHQVRLASAASLLSESDRALFARLEARLPTLIQEPAGGPSLIHGDLWSGNLHVSRDGTPALIDPAVSFSHAEAEFGMMTLFGGFSPRVFAAYHETRPLDAGWRERNGLYQLYHLLNHLNLFGHGYHADVVATARRYD